jgi:HK97 family phage prohead protease
MGVLKREETRHGCGNLYQPRLREAVEGQESRTIEGYAIVFGVMSVLLADYWDVYREVIEKGAVTAEDLKGMDIKMTIWHNRERLLARSNKGVGTLRLTVDDIGVKYEFEAPHTPDGDTALELVRLGNLSGSSFTYWTDEAHNVVYEKDDEDVLVRHVNKISEVLEMTIASDPAYSQTTVTAREVESRGISLRKQKQEKAPMSGVLDYEREQRERILNEF